MNSWSRPRNDLASGRVVVSISVGDAAPDFTLPGTGGQDYSLNDFTGQPVVLVFYPGDDTPVCTKQLNSYNRDIEQFTEMNAQVIGISAQDVSSHEGFANKHGFTFPLLADVDKDVAGLYGTPGDGWADVPSGQRTCCRTREAGSLSTARAGHRGSLDLIGRPTRVRTCVRQ